MPTPTDAERDLAKRIFYVVLEDLTDRRGIRQSPLGEMFDLMQWGADDASNPMLDVASECEEKNVTAIAELLAAAR